MVKVFNQYIDGDFNVTEYTKNGQTVSHIVKTPIRAEQSEFEPHTTIEEQILAENQYQTALLEIQSLGGM